jgi:hypothetical protein
MEYGLEGISSFFKAIQNHHTNFKFTYAKYMSSIAFLDLDITVCKNALQFNIFRKPFYLPHYIPYNSNHPRHIKISIPLNQGRRSHYRQLSFTKNSSR